MGHYTFIQDSFVQAAARLYCASPNLACSFQLYAMTLTKLKALRANITTLEVDAIVNAANNTLLGGGGVDDAIHCAAGIGLLDECRALGGCATGDAKLTGGHNLKARYVIHTVGPVWHGGDQDEEKLLTSCYRRCLELAAELAITSIAFPSISTGVYRFPMEAAAQIAVATCQRYASDDGLQEIVFCCFSDADLAVYQKLTN